MKKRHEKSIITVCIWILATGIQAQNTEFEPAAEAVKNMKVGWNLGNTLDTFANPEKDTWFNSTGWQDWETVWGNPG